MGHKVVYNIGVQTTPFNNITVNSAGMLVFPSTASSTLKISSTSVLTVNSGGEIRTGTTSAAAVVDSAYTLIIESTGSSTRNAIVFADGAIVNLWGSTDVYGGERYAYLDSDWTSGTTLYLQGNLYGKWKAGNVIYIFDNANSYATDGYKYQGDTYTIVNVDPYDSANDRTAITLNSTPSRSCYAVNNSGWRSKLCNLSRNVVIRDYNQTSYEVGAYESFTETIRIYSQQAWNQDLIDFRDCCFQGLYTVFYFGWNVKASNCVCVNNFLISDYSNNYILDIDGISNFTPLAANSCNGTKVTGYFASNNVAFSTAHSLKFTGDLVGNRIALQYLYYGRISADIVCNSTVMSNTYGTNITGDILNNSTIFNSSGLNRIDGAVNNNTTTTSLSAGNIINGDVSSVGFGTHVDYSRHFTLVLEDCTLAGSDRFPLRIYANAGNILPLESGDTDWQTPGSGNTWIMQALPNSYCSYNTFPQQLLYSPLRDMATYAPASSTTITIKIWPVGWSTALDQDDVVLEVKYLDTASGVTRTTVYNTSQTYANGAWRDCSVTFTPSQAGVVYFQLYFRNYESGAYVLIDPIWSIA
jgi:hypothetical protein